MYILNIEENYLTWKPSWKFTHVLRKRILLKMYKTFCLMCSSFISAYANLPNSSCNFSKHRSLFLQTLHQSSMLSSVTPLYFFKLKHYIPWSKEPIKEQIFKIFECSSQNMSNFLCQFSKYKSVFLQILHKSFSFTKDNFSVLF